MWPLACFVVLLQYLVAGDQIRGTPEVDYPTYTEIPRTSFRCSQHGLGFFADLETRCQVFHHCYEHRRETFLCPPGTIFNQGINACDYWYSAECESELESSYQQRSSDGVYEKIASLYDNSESDGTEEDGFRQHASSSATNPQDMKEMFESRVESQQYEEAEPQHASSSENHAINPQDMKQMFEGAKPQDSLKRYESSTDNQNLQFDVMDQNMGQFKFVREDQRPPFLQHERLVFDNERQTHEDRYYLKNEDRHQLISDYPDSQTVYLPMDDAPDDAFGYADDVPDDAFGYADEDHPIFFRRDSSTLHRPPRKSSRPRPVFVEVEPSVEQTPVSIPTRKRIRLNQNQQKFDSLSQEDFFMVPTESSEMTTVATLVDHSDEQANLENSNTETEEPEHPTFYSNDNNEFISQENDLESSEYETAPFEYISDGPEFGSEDSEVDNEERTPFYSNENYAELIANAQEDGSESLETAEASVTADNIENEPLEFVSTTEPNTEWQAVTEYPFTFLDRTIPEEKLEYDLNAFPGQPDLDDQQEHSITNDNSQIKLNSLLIPSQVPIELNEDKIQQQNQDIPAEFIPMTSTEPPRIVHKQDQSVVKYVDDHSEDVSRDVPATQTLQNSDLPSDKTVHDTKEHFHEIANITNEKKVTESTENQTSDENTKQMDHKISDQPFLQDHSWPELSENPPLPVDFKWPELSENPSDFDSIVPPVNTLEHENKESLDNFFNQQSVILSELSPNTLVDSSKAFPSHKVSSSAPQDGPSSTQSQQVKSASFHKVSKSVEGPPSNPQVFGRSLSDPRFINFGFNPNSNYLDTVNFPTLTRQLFNPFNTDEDVMSRQEKSVSTSSGWSSLKLFAKKLMTSKKAAMDTFRAHYNSFEK